MFYDIGLLLREMNKSMFSINWLTIINVIIWQDLPPKYCSAKQWALVPAPVVVPDVMSETHNTRNFLMESVSYWKPHVARSVKEVGGRNQ